jgi:hypothetical protein
MRQALELSITTAPVAPIFGDHSFDTAPPALISTRSTPEKSKLLEVFALQGFVAVADLLADGAARGERNHFVSGKQPLFQNGEHFPAHVSGGADDGYAQSHEFVSRSAGAPPGCVLDEAKQNPGFFQGVRGTEAHSRITFRRRGGQDMVDKPPIWKSTSSWSRTCATRGGRGANSPTCLRRSTSPA